MAAKQTPMTPARKAAIAAGVSAGSVLAAGALTTMGAATYFARRVLRPVVP